MKICLAQLNSTDDVSENLEVVLQLIESAAKDSADLIIFPENTLYFRINSKEKVNAIRLDGAELSEIGDQCRHSGIAAHITTPIADEGYVYNSSVLVLKDGSIKKQYDKMHLFDIELSGQAPIKESDSFKHGASPQVFEFEGFKFGSSICYDIRFSELYSWYSKNKVDVILVPAAFLVKTGMAHWEVLLRARAIESQCYVLAPAQAGTHRSKKVNEVRETFGHTMAVNPWGEVLQKKSEDVGIVTIEIRKEEIEKVRRQIPMAEHRRKF